MLGEVSTRYVPNPKNLQYEGPGVHLPLPLKAQSVSSLMSILRLSILCTCLFDGHRRTGLNGCRFPLFHRPSFEEKLNQNEHLKDTGLFTSTMAACALASARARDGALFSARWQSTDLSQPPSEMFFNAAKDLIPKDLGNAKGTSFMRACALLAITSIQNGQIRSMQQYIGYYHTLMAMDGRHDEKLWPKDLTPIEKEERRRLVSC